MLQEAEIAKALAVLFVAHFDPATEDKPRLRQCLSVFFPTYAATSSSHQHHISRAFRRAARGALGVAPIKKAPAPQLMRYMLQVRTTHQPSDDHTSHHHYCSMCQRSESDSLPSAQLCYHVIHARLLTLRESYMWDGTAVQLDRPCPQSLMRPCLCCSCFR